MSFDVLTRWHKSSQGLAWSGALLAPLFWVLDAVLDFFVFDESESFYAALFLLEPVELWMRLLVSFMFIAFGIYAARLLKRAERVEQALRDSNGKLEFLSKELERLTVVDPLTGIFNRRKFHQMLDVMMAMALRHRHQFALVMLDVDHFKQINDRFG
ncbi:MAG: diguanylate cyclase, partial [Gallionellaceae bacterium]